MLKGMNVKRLGSHLLFWTMFLLYRLTTNSVDKALIGDYWWGDWKILHILIVGIAFKALFAYGLIYFIVPRYLDRKRYGQFAVLAFVWLYAVIALYFAAHYFYLERLYTVYMGYGKETLTTMYSRLTTVGFLIGNFSNFLAPAIVLGAIKYYRRKIRLAEVEEEKNRMELKALKNQLNPHFLFNTLNNIYSYVVTESPKAPEMIMRLSGILDYVLYRSQNKTVALKEEVATIENFLKLEQIRYGDRLQVSFVVNGSLNAAVSPLILLSIVENAFKHGASGDIDQPQIKIAIAEEAGVIRCEVWNTKSDQVGEKNDAYKEGIGLHNIERQLNLVYPDTHELVVEDQRNSFLVTLTINPAR